MACCDEIYQPSQVLEQLKLLRCSRVWLDWCNPSWHGQLPFWRKGGCNWYLLQLFENTHYSNPQSKVGSLANWRKFTRACSTAPCPSQPLVFFCGGLGLLPFAFIGIYSHLIGFPNTIFFHVVGFFSGLVPSYNGCPGFLLLLHFCVSFCFVFHTFSSY